MNKIHLKKYLIVISIALLVSCSPKVKYEYPFQDPGLPTDVRVEDLISRLSLSEKAAQLLYDAPAIDRLKIPEYNWWNECLHGVARNGLATVFPQAIGMAATFDTAQITRVATIISDEARAKYHYAVAQGSRHIYQGLTFWTPNINIFRDPRWGRGMETYGEDPFLSGEIGVNFIKGLQGNHPEYLKTIATAKHFAVHSGPEYSRHTFNAEINDFDLYNTYLPHFRKAVEKAQVQSLMCAYNRVDGEPCCGSAFLLQDIIRDTWGFEGYIVTDCWGIVDFYNGHSVSDGPAEAAALAITSGTDLNCVVTFNHLVEAVEKGLIEETDIDQALARLLTARFKLGLFDPDSKVPFSKIPADIVDSPTHKEAALETARKSMVLLKNEHDLLPLKKDIGTIAVIGPHATDEEAMLANYNGIPSEVISPLEGIIDHVDSSTKVIYAQGCEIAEGLPHLTIISGQFLYSDSSFTKHGLRADFFNNNSFEGEPIESTTHLQIDFNWWDEAPLPKMNNDNFSVRWTGYLIPEKSGYYHIGGDGSNEFKIYLNDSLIAENTNLHFKMSDTREVFLESGKSYHIKVEHINYERFAMMQLVWDTPDQSLEEEALAAAAASDVVILCMGLSPRLEGEEMEVKIEGFKGGDRVTLGLPSIQLNLMKKIKELGKPMVLVLFNGSALSINWENENIPAILEAWYPGQSAGTAVADILFGDFNPAGRLPVTFYKSVADLPDFEDYNMKGRTYRYFEGDPLYPFGYGLSYSDFDYGRLALTSLSIDSNTSCTVAAQIYNASTQNGEEVVQLYIRAVNSSVARPVKELKGFRRILIPSGETREVAFTIEPSMLSFYNDAGELSLEPGKYEIMLGSSSEDIRLRQFIHVN